MSADLPCRRLRSRATDLRPTVDEVLDHLIFRRLRNNQNVVCAICGETGSGKSYSALRLAELTDPLFTSARVCFTVPEFLNALESAPENSAIIFDESQEWNARRSMSRKNVQMSEIMAMMRFRKVNVFFTAPSIQMIDVNARRLMHLYAHVIPVSRTGPLRNLTVAHFYQVRNRSLPSAGSGPGGGGILFSVPRIPIVRQGRRIAQRCSGISFRAPSASLLEDYERRKAEAFAERLAQARGSLGSLPSSPPSIVEERDEPDEDNAARSPQIQIFGRRM